MEGSTGRQRVPASAIARLTIKMPPLPEQKAIASILGALDDKIELNRKMNETLEAIARAIFKSWFVDFDPIPGLGPHKEWQDSPLGKIPKGWRVGSLDGIADYLNGLALQKYPPENDYEFLPVIKIAQLRKDSTEGSDKASVNIDPSYVVSDGDILFSWSGSLEVVIWCGGRGALNQHLFKVTSKNYPKWFYYLWTKHYLPDFQAIAAGKATTMGHIQRHHLATAKVLIPPPNLLKAMDTIMSPLIENKIVNSVQSRTLASIRDALLPRLLSGEIRVKDAERFVVRAL
jgi:type I restriction enzyme S subunit